MKEIKTKLNISRLIFISILYSSFILFLMSIIYLLTKVNDDQNFINISSILGLIFSILTVSIIIFFFRKISNLLTYISISENGIYIFQPLKFKSIFYGWSSIKGYSKSDYFYTDPMLQSSKSIIIYMKNNLTFEIIKMYTINFIDFQTYLNKSKVVCFGTESNKKSNFGRRKRKYIELYNE